MKARKNALLRAYWLSVSLEWRQCIVFTSAWLGGLKKIILLSVPLGIVPSQCVLKGLTVPSVASSPLYENWHFPWAENDSPCKNMQLTFTKYLKSSSEEGFFLHNQQKTARFCRFFFLCNSMATIVQVLGKTLVFLEYSLVYVDFRASCIFKLYWSNSHCSQRSKVLGSEQKKNFEQNLHCMCRSKWS